MLLAVLISRRRTLPSAPVWERSTPLLGFKSSGCAAGEQTLSLFSELETKGRSIFPGLHGLVSDVTTLKVTFGLKDLIRDVGLQAETHLQC